MQYLVQCTIQTPFDYLIFHFVKTVVFCIFFVITFFKISKYKVAVNNSSQFNTSCFSKKETSIYLFDMMKTIFEILCKKLS